MVREMQRLCGRILLLCLLLAVCGMAYKCLLQSFVLKCVFITVSTKACHYTLSIYIFRIHVHLGLPSGLFLWTSIHKISLIIFFILAVCATCSVHLAFLWNVLNKCARATYIAVIQITELHPDFLQFVITSCLCLSILFILEGVVVWVCVCVKGDPASVYVQWEISLLDPKKRDVRRMLVLFAVYVIIS
jgi:hypothetical protein